MQSKKVRIKEIVKNTMTKKLYTQKINTKYEIGY